MMEQLAANIIAENMMSQVDSGGHHYQVLTEVTDHKNDDSAIAKVDGFIKSSIGKLHRKRTTRIWRLLVEWKDGPFDWVPLKELKQYNPVDLAEYAVANEISDEPAFKWWVKGTLLPSPFHIKYNTTPSSRFFTKSCCGCCYHIIRRIENLCRLE